MFRFQQDHFLLALDDLFSRYRPKVPKHLYSVAFVPIVDDDEAQFKPDDWLKARTVSHSPIECDFRVSIAFLMRILNIVVH